jgi:hypothetical protein
VRPLPPSAGACGNCGAAFQPLRLAGHYGQAVELDLCAPCHLVWFDSVESARLGGPAQLQLIGAMAAAQTLAHQPLKPALACARCRGPVHEVHNRTRFGQSRQLECRARHGAYQSFAQFLAERGLTRPMTSADRQRAHERDGAIACLNCGGAIAPADPACSWCGSVPALVDVARLARSLDPEGALEPQPVHGSSPRSITVSCAACGAAQSDQGVWRCEHCAATLAAPALAEAHQALLALGPALQAHARKPSADVVRRRLAAQEPALQRQRQRAAEMQAEADAQQRTVLGLPRQERNTAQGFIERWLESRFGHWLPGWALSALPWALLALFLWAGLRGE